MLTTVVMRSPGGARPLAAAQPVGEVAHRVQHVVHVGDDVLAVDRQLRAARQPQRGVQHGAVLGGVDVLAGEHRVAALLEVGGPGEVDEQFQRLAGDPVLAVVDVQVADGQGQFGATLGVLGEELAKVRVADLRVMALQCMPGGSSGDIGDLLGLGGHSPTLVRRRHKGVHDGCMDTRAELLVISTHRTRGSAVRNAPARRRSTCSTPRPTRC